MNEEELQTEIDNLRNKVRILAEENEVLTDQAEDIYLLGVIAEKIGLENTGENVISIAMESIATLKDISYCAFITTDNKSLKIIDDFGLNIPTSQKGKVCTLSNPIRRHLENKDYFIEIPDNESWPEYILYATRDIRPNSCYLMPIVVRDNVYGILLIVNCIGDSEYLKRLIPLLKRVGGLMEARLETLSFLDEIRELNTMLEAKVEERTVNLKMANTRLEKEMNEHKRTAEALRESEEKYANLFSSMRDVIIIADSERRIINANQPALRDLFGYELNEIVGKNSEILYADAKEYVHAGKEIFDKQHNVVAKIMEIDFRQKNGTVFSGELYAMKLLDKQGEPTGNIGIVRDITRQKKMEEELQKGQKLESIGILAGGIAHDFNNLLAAIINNLFLIKMHTKPKGEIYERAVGAEKASMRAQALTNQLLTFSKGGAPIKERISIGQLIGESVSFSLRGSNVQCEIVIPEDLWSSEVDAGQINQVINNIIINADQSMPDGGILTIRCENITIGDEKTIPLRSGDYVKISIKDQGTGISGEHIAKIFDPFFTTKQKGSGLGLSSAYSIIKRHHGYVDVESELGVGTLFNIYLPASTEKIIDESLPEEEPLKGEGRVLIMDDDEYVRESLGEILRKMGYQVEFANNGNETIEIYQQAMMENCPFNTVIMDLTIPGGKGGKETIKELCKIDPNVKAIVSSGYSYDPIMANYRAFGFKAVLSKPYKDIVELSKIVDHVIKC